MAVIAPDKNALQNIETKTSQSSLDTLSLPAAPRMELGGDRAVRLGGMPNTGHGKDPYSFHSRQEDLSDHPDQVTGTGRSTLAPVLMDESQVGWTYQTEPMPRESTPGRKQSEFPARGPGDISFSSEPEVNTAEVELATTYGGDDLQTVNVFKLNQNGEVVKGERRSTTADLSLAA